MYRTLNIGYAFTLSKFVFFKQLMKSYITWISHNEQNQYFKILLGVRLLITKEF